jgi:hypothetical protein
MAGLLDVCRFNPTAGGTTDWTYSSAVTGYQSPAAAGAINGAVYRYRAESADLTQWEVGYGAWNSSTGVLARTTVLFNSAGTTAKINFSAAPQVAIVALAEDIVNKADMPVVTVITSGSGTYTTPTGARYLRVRLVGGGGGGGGSANSTANGAAGGTGGTTSFGTMSATGGNGGGGSGQPSSSGGLASGGDVNLAGISGAASVGAGFGATTLSIGGLGGPSVFGGAGPGGYPGANGLGGLYGGGGGGGGGPPGVAGFSGGGGSAGGYAEKIITSPAASYSYVVGAGGSAGVAGTSGFAGGTGGSGLILVEAYL